MKQRARILIGYTHPGGEKQGGFSCRNMVELEQDMGFTVLGRKGLERLGKVETMYLLDELKDRGFSVQMLEETMAPEEEKPLLTNMSVFGMAEALYGLLERTEGVSLRDFLTEFMAYAFSREPTQKDVARKLGMSPRMANYYHTKVVKDGVRIPNRLIPPEYREEEKEGGEDGMQQRREGDEEGRTGWRP